MGKWRAKGGDENSWLREAQRKEAREAMDQKEAARFSVKARPADSISKSSPLSGQIAAS